MNRNLKFPCAQHYIPRDNNPDGTAAYWDEEELERQYDPRCSECRDYYKRYEVIHLFTDKFFNFKFSFHPWRTIKALYKFSLEYGWSFIKQRILKECVYAVHRGYDGWYYTYQWFLFFDFEYRMYTFYDLHYDGEIKYIDIEKLEVIKYNEEKDIQMRDHQINVLKRYKRMFGDKL